jgi:hypothetical protein
LPSARKLVLLCHRWLGTAFCLLFCLWFLSGFGMMYWDYPEVGPAERFEHAQLLDPERVLVPPDQAYAALGLERPPSQARLSMFDGRPAYRFRLGRRSYLVYADDGRPQPEFPPELTRRVASDWTGQPASAGHFDGTVDDPDQWTLGGARALRPFDKYSWANGAQVYVSKVTGEVAQYTTSTTRWGAYLGPIPHWLYFTHLRKNGSMWNRLVVWLSGAGVIVSLLGLIGGVWLYSPSQRYRSGGAPSSIPYSGQKRWHMLFGLVFGLTASTWVFSGLLSMEPFDVLTQGPETGPSGLLRGTPALGSFGKRPPREALRQIGSLKIKELEFSEFDGQSVYLATEAPDRSLVIPVEGDPTPEFDRTRLLDMVASAADPYQIAEVRTVEKYEAYYIARHGELPLPALFVRLDDPERSTFYIDPKTARVVASYTTASRWNRWLYHGLHSWNLPWLYRYRPAWELLVIPLLAGGSALSITGVVIGWRLLRRTLAAWLHPA